MSARAEPLNLELSSSHWGAYEVVREQGVAVGLRGNRFDPDPSPIGLSMWQAYQSALRVRKPAFRAGWLDDLQRGRHGSSSERGKQPFVELNWDEALKLVSGELRRVIDAHGNEAIFGGSYGWSSAGRFHHAQSQVHRFLNMLGGYVRHVDTYSLGAGRAVMPHIVGSMDELFQNHHDWQTLADHTKLMVCFGGIPIKNTQVGSGGASDHQAAGGLRRLAQAGCKFVNFSPARNDLSWHDHSTATPGAAATTGAAATNASIEWIAIRPNTDTAVMLALACEIILANRHDQAFLDRYCVGFERWRGYLLGTDDGVVKNADWASAIAEVSAERLRALAMQLTQTRSLVNVAWSLQRADHGEQPFWAAVGLASVIGQIGLPGGGFGLGYGPANTMGSAHRRLPGPTLPQGRNAVQTFIPVARIADMLLNPGAHYPYNGRSLRYPDIKLIYWAGGNPFHHHQDLNRLARAWRKPDTIVVHEQVWNAHAKMADVVLPATSNLERDDLGHSARDPLLIAMKQLIAAPGLARDDYAIFSALAQQLGAHAEFTEGRDAAQWLRHLYGQAKQAMAALGTAEQAAEQSAEQAVELPEFDAFWQAGGVKLPANPQPVVLLEAFRRDPQRAPLSTPSGRIELFSSEVASWSYPDCPGFPIWLKPVEWLGADAARHWPLHLLSDQPHTKLHSQLDFSALSLANKVQGREPILMNPRDARERGLADGDLVRVFNARGACLAGLRVTSDLRPGVVRLATGAWWDPPIPGDVDSIDRHGNPNALTRDQGSSSLGQGCSAQSCLVQIERFVGVAPAMKAFEPPEFVELKTPTVR